MAADAKAVERSMRWERKQVSKHRCPRDGNKTGDYYYCAKCRKRDRERKAAA